MNNFPMNQMPLGGSQHQMQPGMNAQQMPQGTMDPAMLPQQLHELCQQYQHHLVQFETSDGQMVDGIIDGVDREGVNILLPVGDMDDDQRFGGYGGYGGFPGYGYPRRFRRFRRQHFPFFFLRRFLFPYFY